MPLPPDFINELSKRFTGDIRDDLASRILYSTDASMYQIEPKGVVIPKTQDDLQAAVELAAKYKIPILPRGAGTSLAGQAIGDALILDCSRWLDSILEVDPESRTATVEPGVVLSHLNHAAAKHGLMYGPDPASADRASMGGVIATNATGAHSLTYGMTADHLVSADVLMADGSMGVLGERSTLDNSLISKLYSSALKIREQYAASITQHWPRAWRNSAGYRLNYLLPWSATRPSQWAGEDYPANLKPGTLNLTHLLAGSEGTLAIIRRATVKLVERPKYTVLAVLTYQSNAQACNDVPRLLTHHPSAVELIPRFIIRQARSVPAYARQMGWVAGDPAALLVVEFSGDQPSALKDAARKIGEVLTIAESKEDQARIWNVRRVGLGLLDSRPQSERPAAFIEDCAIPVDRLGEFVREVEVILSAHGTEGGIYAHASAGCLHIRPILDLKTTRGVSSLRSISEAALALTLRLGGAMSSEHGDGLARAEFLERTVGPELMEAMRMLKRSADPDNLLNPGKIIDAPKMDLNLRYGEQYKTRIWNSNLSFARNGGLDIAIEQCNGQGLCRKDSGVMCPSYQATRDEMHSTRGRANLLRAFLSSPMSLRAYRADIVPEGWRTLSEEKGQTRRGRSNPLAKGEIASSLTPFAPHNDMVESVAQALDLCLACKGCKAECPSGVDMAKLKYAFQAEYYKTHRRQLRDYVFGYFHITAMLAASVAPLSNALMSIPWFRNSVAGMLGVTTKRPFPTFTSRRAKAHITGTRKRGEKIIFLTDPFAHYIEPELEQAGLDVLSRCGYDLHVLPVIGAGASFLSKGFIDQAKRHAARVLDALNKIDPARQAVIVGIEPPEIYCLKHDYVDLLPKRESEIEQRVKNVWLLDEFLLRSKEFNHLRVVTSENKSNYGNSYLSTNEESASSLTWFAPRNDIKIRFHPHCHQRAEAPSEDGLPSGSGATLELLRSCGYDVELLDTGCCGMAGTFGYEAEHYELSMKVGELKLFPLLRTPTQPPPNPQFNSSLLSRDPRADLGEVSQSDGGGRVVSSGAACRMQIKQGTGVEAVHSIMLVADFLKEAVDDKK
ncbi:MAG TPA: FAD-linked oxidase C-terminal domain-containing protein [Anaerolineales bacterium]|nr:FAD-linked oxidase C-terminal domain-containing protein [Anaerolineales bacterium]